MPRSREENIDMMRSFTRWVHIDKGFRRALPICGPNCGMMGFLIKEKSKPSVDPTVYVGNVFLWAMGKPIERIITYESFDALYDAGWRVD